MPLEFVKLLEPTLEGGVRGKEIGERGPLLSGQSWGEEERVVGLSATKVFLGNLRHLASDLDEGRRQNGGSANQKCTTAISGQLSITREGAGENKADGIDHD